MNPDLSFLNASIPHLQPLLNEVVFIGGAIVPLYVTDPAVLYVRPTLDLDILTTATTYNSYQATVDKLLAIGFQHDINGPICRLIKQGVIVDLMSPDVSVLGFANHWYQHALTNPTQYLLPNGLTIQIPTPPLMLATKLVAYDFRGKQDPAISKDLDDIVTLLDGRAELLEEIPQSPKDLQAYIANNLQVLASHKIVRYILPGLFLGPDSESRHDRFHRRLLTLTNPLH
jgi:hypothetical protein